MKRLTVITIVVLAVVIALPIAGLVLKSGAEFGGADSGGQNAITQIDPSYRPWFSNIWNQSTRTNEVMFGVQGALGAGILFAALGYFVGRARGRGEAAAGKETPLSAGVVIAYVVIGVVAFAAVPLLYYGAGYRPPSSEIICLFFALNGAIGSGFICFALTFFWGRGNGRTQGPPQPACESQPSGGAS
jgi:cobalt/nickel transport protein